MKTDRKDRFAQAEQPMSDEHRQILQWLRTVKFRRNFFGGVQEADVWAKLEELNRLYEKALLVERTRRAEAGEGSHAESDTL